MKLLIATIWELSGGFFFFSFLLHFCRTFLLHFCKTPPLQEEDLLLFSGRSPLLGLQVYRGVDLRTTTANPACPPTVGPLDDDGKLPTVLSLTTANPRRCDWKFEICLGSFFLGLLICLGTFFWVYWVFESVWGLLNPLFESRVFESIVVWVLLNLLFESFDKKFQDLKHIDKSGFAMSLSNLVLQHTSQ